MKQERRMWYELLDMLQLWIECMCERENDKIQKSVRSRCLKKSGK